MSNLDIEIFKQVLEKFEPGDLEPDILETVIRSISRWYATKKQRGLRISSCSFHERYGLTLLHYGIEELFSAKNYRSALGHYFSQRSVLKRLHQPLVKDPIAPINKAGMMMGVGRDKASVYATPSDILKFIALKETGQLHWHDVKKLDGQHVPKKAYQKAHQQALAAMNSRRVGEI